MFCNKIWFLLKVTTVEFDIFVIETFIYISTSIRQLDSTYGIIALTNTNGIWRFPKAHLGMVYAKRTLRFSVFPTKICPHTGRTYWSWKFCISVSIHSDSALAKVCTRHFFSRIRYEKYWTVLSRAHFCECSSVSGSRCEIFSCFSKL